MTTIFCRAAVLVITVAMTSVPISAETIPDNVYLQEIGEQIESSVPLRSAAVHDGSVYFGTPTGLVVLDGDQLRPVSHVPFPVSRLVATNDSLWVIGSPGLHRYRKGAWQQVTDLAVTDVTEHLSRVIVSVGRQLATVQDDKLAWLVESGGPFPIQRVVSHCETLYVQGAGRLTLYDGDRIGGRNVFNWGSDEAWDWGELPSKQVTDAICRGSRLILSTDRGLGILRGMSVTRIQGQDGLCYEDTTCLAAGFDSDVWIGTTRGAIRMVDDSFHYFAGRRWLPHDRVNSIAATDDAVYIATDKGVGIIWYQPYTLLKKAAYYEQHLEQWGQKRLGFTHKLEWDRELGEFVREISDNDGGYSGNYLAAQCYRYAVTKDPAARTEAVKTFQALRWLRRMSSVPGLPARSVWVKGERGHKAMHGSGEADAEWHDTAYPRFEWKGDTSSDEICSHFYSTTLFLKHVAQGDEIAQAKEHLGSIAHHLIDNEWKLIDVDGKPTRWGRWDPEYFTTEEGLYDRGLQALQILSFVRTSAALNGDRKSIAAYDELVQRGYHGFTLRSRNTFPPGGVLHFLDGLGFWSYWTILQFEESPKLRSAYRRSLERSYEIVRIEQNPWFNFVYSALSGNPTELQPAVKHLREWPLDLISWSFRNSHRTDLHTPDGYVPYKAGTRTFSPRETGPMRWDHWAMKADGGAGGRDVVEPGGWLLAYWMGRYYDYIGAPTTSDPRLLTVDSEPEGRLGARPYEGPGWPE